MLAHQNAQSDAESPCLTSPPRKTWTAAECLKDHVTVAKHLPRILGAYVGSNSIAPKLNEAIMLSVNAVNQCPYCSGLHGQLARMAGVEDPDKLERAASAKEAREIVDDPAITYAHTFADNNGRGSEVDQAFGEVASRDGTGRANAAQALCWFLLWGSIGGNTLNAIVGGTHPGSLIYKVLYVVYYGPLFLIIAVLNQALVFFPVVPAWFSASIGVILTLVAGTWILPVGLLGILGSPFL